MKETTQHTPGPWNIWSNRQTNVNGYPAQVVGSEHHAVASIHAGDTTTEANARLIAAAPELLAALQAIVEFADNGTPVHPGAEVISDARAAIAAATAH